MAVTIDWLTQVISVPLVDLTQISVSPDIYQLDVDTFRLALKAIEGSEEGAPFLDTHQHNTEVTVGGVTLARVVEIINGYTVTFENGTYRVNLIGANHNILDVLNYNSVQVASSNSAGLQTVTSGSGLDSAQDALLTQIGVDVGTIDATTEQSNKILKNKRITNKTTGEDTIFDDDDVTPYLTRTAYEDEDGTQTYRGNGADRVERYQ